MLEIDKRAISAAPPERVWELLADARTWVTIEQTATCLARAAEG